VESVRSIGADRVIDVLVRDREPSLAGDINRAGPGTQPDRAYASPT
jgi:hypothetical protein